MPTHTVNVSDETLERLKRLQVDLTQRLGHWPHYDEIVAKGLDALEHLLQEEKDAREEKRPARAKKGGK